MTSRWRHHAEPVAGPGVLQPLDEARCWILVHRGTVGRVGLGRTDGTALIVPVNDTVSGRSLYFRSRLGAIAADHVSGRATRHHPFDHDDRSCR